MTEKIGLTGTSFFLGLALIQRKVSMTLDGLAFACGPGSYTALRITASFLKAIAEVKELPLIAISNLESIAHQASQWIDEAEAKIYVAIEADSKESYFCSYQKNKDELTPIIK